MNLREHHSVNPEYPAGPGGRNDGFDEGLCNGWFPTQRLEENRERGIVTCTDPDGNVSRYETYSFTRKNSHSEDTCTMCIHRRRCEEEELKRRIERRRRPEEQQRVVVAPQLQNIHEGEALRWTRLFPTEVNNPEGDAHAPEPAPGPSNVADDPDQDNTNTDEDGRYSAHADSTDEVAQYHSEASQALGEDAHVIFDHEMHTADEGSEHSADIESDIDEEDYESDSASEFSESDTEWTDFIENSCNGIQDIIVTGEVRLSTLHHISF